jgi:hypothetical protein
LKWLVWSHNQRIMDPVTPIRRRLSAIPDSELDAVIVDGSSSSICQRYYKCNGENLTELMTMCYRLRSIDDRTLGDVLLEPYVSMKFKKKVTPTQKHMVEEVKRRSRCDTGGAVQQLLLAITGPRRRGFSCGCVIIQSARQRTFNSWYWKKRAAF